MMIIIERKNQRLNDLFCQNISLTHQECVAPNAPSVRYKYINYKPRNKGRTKEGRKKTNRWAGIVKVGLKTDRERGGERGRKRRGDVWMVGSILRFAERDGRYSQLSEHDRCLTAERHAQTVGCLGMCLQYAYSTERYSINLFS
jgi:hypothetical protein